MNKPRGKKMLLNRETVRALSADELKAAAGGISLFVTLFGCIPTVNFCPNGRTPACNNTGSFDTAVCRY